MININYVNGDRHSRVYNGRQLASVMGQEPISYSVSSDDEEEIGVTHFQSSKVEVRLSDSYNSQGEPADRVYPCNGKHQDSDGCKVISMWQRLDVPLKST